MYFVWQGWKKFCPPRTKICSGVSHKSSPFEKETRVILTFPPVQNPKRFSTSHSTWLWHRSKSTTLHIHQHTSSSFGLLHPHQSPPFYSNLAKHRNLILQEHMPPNSLLRFKIFCCLWACVKFFPIIMRLVAHNWQTFVLAVLMRLIVLEHQRMSKSCPGDKTVLPLCVRDKIILSQQFKLRAHMNGTTTVLVDTLGFCFLQDWPSRGGSSGHLQMNNLNRLDFSKRRSENRFWFHTGVVLHDMIEWINFYSIIFSQ